MVRDVRRELAWKIRKRGELPVPTGPLPWHRAAAPPAQGAPRLKVNGTVRQ